LIPYTSKTETNNQTVYCIDIKEEIALCRYVINSYLFSSANLNQLAKKYPSRPILNSNMVESGVVDLTTDKQYLDLEDNATLYQPIQPNTIDNKPLFNLGYSYIKIPRYKITENTEEKYFKLLSIPSNRTTVSQSDYSGQYLFSLGEEDEGLNYSTDEKNINAKY
jgi:hypothetical protein